MRISDIISETILQMLADSQNGSTEIRRNELAGMLGCVPSQINYVLSSRFTPEQGYIVESRRGGGGYIRITRVRLNRSSAIMHLINSLGSELGSSDAHVLVENLKQQEVIPPKAAALMESALSDKAYADVSPQLRNRLRAAVFKQMLIACI